VAPSIASAAPAGGTQGAAYSHTCTASGSTPITYSVTSGALPTGLTLSSGGVISGTPTVAGTFTGTIGAANGTAPNASQAFSITIAQGIVFTSAPPPSNGNVVSAYNHTCTVIGTAPVTFSVTSGALPTGLTLSAAGVISGTPNTVGTFNGVITAANGLAPAATQNFTIVIAPATAGTLTLTATLGTLGSGSDEHWSVAWITKSDGTFVKTVDIRGNELNFWDVHWNDHCSTWYAARGASQALDGFTSATSTSYAAPLVVTWNGRDASNNLMPDGTYKLWVQYAENIDPASGPFTTGGLTWTKGPTVSTINPPNQGSNFTAMSMVWTPAVTAAPEIAVEQPAGTNLADGGTKDFGSVIIGANSTLTFTIKNTGAADLTGLTITKDGSNPADFTIVATPVAPVAGPAGTTTFAVQFTPGAAGSRSASIHLANNDSDENPFDITLTGTGITAYDSWAISAGLGAGADPAAAPKGDGVTNLQKFAFNMDASKADLRRLVVGAGGLAGLPGTEVASGPVLRMEYIRRKASTNPGITYTAQLGSDLTGWTTVAGVATSIDGTWERVLVTDPPPAGAAKRFGRLKVSQP